MRSEVVTVTLQFGEGCKTLVKTLGRNLLSLIIDFTSEIYHSIFVTTVCEFFPDNSLSTKNLRFPSYTVSNLRRKHLSLELCDILKNFNSKKKKNYKTP